MSRAKELIEKVIEDLKRMNKNGFYSNTIEALEKIMLDFGEHETSDGSIKKDQDRD